MFTKPLTRAPRYILIKAFLLAIALSYLLYLSHALLKRLKLLWGEIAFQTLRFLQITAEHQYCPVFTVFLTIPIISISRYRFNRFRWNFKNIGAAIGGKSSRERFWKDSSQCREIHGVISLPCQLRCYCNLSQSKFSSLSNTAVVVIFPNLSVNGDVVYVQTYLGGFDPEKPYRVTLSQT